MNKINNKKAGASLIIPDNSFAGDVSQLPLAEKISSLREMSNKERLDRIVADPEAKRIVRVFEPQELYWMIKDIGESDVSELLEFCSPEQITFFLDMDCWNKCEFCMDTFYEWLGYLLEAGEERIVELLPHLEPEFLILSFMKEISVGGGVGDMATEAEVENDWDHTFDNCYMISFKNAGHASLIGRLIDIIYRNLHPLYLTLMESIRTEVPSEIEELSYRFRSARLADTGFPEFEDALSIYAYIDPATYTPAEGKKIFSGYGERPGNLQLPTCDSSPLKKALLSAGSEGLLMELQYLINNAIVAEGSPMADGDVMRGVLQRVYGYLNIALEFLCGENEVKISAMLENEQLKTLFQLGRSIVAPLRKTAEKLHLADTDLGYAANKVLLGLKAEQPKFYRGLDPDIADGYREFKSMDDIQKMRAFLDSIDKKLW
jgi:hypothetical protein